MDKEKRSYISYMLRLQRVRRWGDWVWWASLENPVTGQRQSFSDLSGLFAFLEAQTRRETPCDESGKGRNGEDGDSG
jgi:hypothetical protein